MKERKIRPRTRVAFGVSLLAGTFAALVACGGQSIRHMDDGAAGEPDDPPAHGGSPNGGRGGSGAVGPVGGTTSFTGGTSSGGSIAIGGTGPAGTGGTGGSIAIGGTGAVGTGGIGTGGCAPGGPISQAPLAFEEDGIIYPGSNPYGISGGWYSFDDCASASAAGLPCTVRNGMFVGPDGLAGWTSDANTACASGKAARVELGPDGTPAYALQWGFGLGVSLNRGAPWDAASQCVRGFVMTLEGRSPAVIRVNVVTTKTSGVSHFVEVPIGAGPVVVDFASVRQGSWVAGPTPLDLTQITDLQFHVYTNEQTPVEYHFCISDIYAYR